MAERSFIGIARVIKITPSVWITVDIHPETLWGPGHEVFDWANGVRRDLLFSTKRAAPPFVSKAKWPRQGTGALNAGIYATMARVGPESIDMQVGSRVSYTMFVHGGTAFKKGSNFIYSREGFANKATVDALAESGFALGRGTGIPPRMQGLFMALPTFSGFVTQAGRFRSGQSKRFHLRVHGQSANPFLLRGMNHAAIKHPCLGEPWTGVIGL